MQHSTHSTITLLAAATIALGASARTTPEYAWGKLFDGKTSAGDQNTAIAVGADHSVYWYNNLGSADGSLDIYFGDKEIFEGASYTGTSNNSNFSITKTDADGNELWTVYSNSGDFANQQGGVAVAADDSVVFTAKVRHTEGHTDSPVNFVDASGRSTAVGGSVDTRYYFLVIGKISSDGELMWVRTARPATEIDVDGKATTITDCVTVTGGVLDSDGNIFVGGSFALDLEFEGRTSDVVITATDTEGWNGKGTVSDLFLARFDADGYCTGAIHNTGNKMSEVKILTLASQGDNIIFHGTAKPLADGEKTCTLGTATITAGDVASPFTGSLDALSLTVDWLKSVVATTVDGGSAYQNATVSISGDNIWVAAMGNGTFTAADDPEKTISTATKNLREGFIFKFSKADGSWIAATTSRTGFPDIAMLTGYLNAFQNQEHPDHVYVYGYVMNAAHGAFIRTYNATTLQAVSDDCWNLVTVPGGTPTAVNIAYDPTLPAAYLTVRGNKAFAPTDGTASAAPSGWAIYATRFDLPADFLSGIEDVSADIADVEITGDNGNLIIRTSRPTVVNVSDLMGRTVASVAVNGTASLPLPSGLYIAAGKKALVR